MSLFIHQEGDCSLPPLLLLHSGGMTHKEWQPQLAGFSKKFHVITPDLPGHGASRLSLDDEISISNYAKITLNMLDDMSVDSISIVGSSTGAAIALYIAIHYPDRLDKLVLYRMGYKKDPDAYEETKRIASPLYWEQYGMASWMSKQHLEQEESPAAAKEAWKAVVARVAMLFSPEKTDHSHELSDLEKITNHTLIVAGDRDPLISMKTVLAMSDAIPNSAVWILPNASHVTATNTWRAKIFSDEVLRFLSL